MQDIEEWKVFPLDFRYEVSTYGRIRRVNTLKVRKLQLKQNGYLGLVLSHPGKRKPSAYDLHSMVAVTWLGTRPKGMDVSHLDGNRLNNRLENLKYESRLENSNKYFNRYNKNGGKRQLTEEMVHIIRKDKLHSNSYWAEKLHIKRVTIWKARTYRTWKYL